MKVVNPEKSKEGKTEIGKNIIHICGLWNMASSFTAKWALNLVLMGFWVLLTGKKTLEIDSSQALFLE